MPKIITRFASEVNLETLYSPEYLTLFENDRISNELVSLYNYEDNIEIKSNKYKDSIFISNEELICPINSSLFNMDDPAVKRFLHYREALNLDEELFRIEFEKDEKANFKHFLTLAKNNNYQLKKDSASSVENKYVNYIVSNEEDDALISVKQHESGKITIELLTGSPESIEATALALKSMTKLLIDPNPTNITGVVPLPKLIAVPDNHLNLLAFVKDLKVSGYTTKENPENKIEIFNDNQKTPLVTVNKNSIQATTEGDSELKQQKIEAFVAVVKEFMANNDIAAYEIDCVDEKMLLEATKKLIEEKVPIKILNPKLEQRIFNQLDAIQQFTYEEAIKAVNSKLDCSAQAPK